MTPRRFLATVSSLTLATLVAGVSLLTAGTTSARTITLVVHYESTSFKTDDVLPKGNSAGDQTFFSGALTRNGKPSGRLEDMDIAIDRQIQGFARWATLLLPEGTIVAAGAGGNKSATGWHHSATDKLAVLGGTNTYSGATGEIAIRDLPNGQQRLTITLR